MLPKWHFFSKSKLSISRKYKTPCSMPRTVYVCRIRTIYDHISFILFSLSISAIRKTYSKRVLLLKWMPGIYQPHLNPFRLASPPPPFCQLWHPSLLEQLSLPRASPVPLYNNTCILSFSCITGILWRGGMGRKMPVWVAHISIKALTSILTLHPKLSD